MTKYIIADVSRDGGYVQFWSSRTAPNPQTALSEHLEGASRASSAHVARIEDEDVVRFVVAPALSIDAATVNIANVTFFDVSEVSMPRFEVKPVGS